jgi:hypothetical protein
MRKALREFTPDFHGIQGFFIVNSLFTQQNVVTACYFD